MPTMFDSHEEFNEWFSKDIESHAEKKSALDQEQLSRLHMILKPFMLRRIKRDVEHEMAEKVGGTLLTKNYLVSRPSLSPVFDCLQYVASFPGSPEREMYTRGEPGIFDCLQYED